MPDVASRAYGSPVKYDRPVRELLAECVATLPQPFTTEQVLRWFRSHYPDIARGTIATQMAGLTSGNRPHRHLASYPPLLDRVGHGLYQRASQDAGKDAAVRNTDGERAPRASRELVQANVQDGTVARVVLIGCVRSKHGEAAPAKDLYTSRLFAKRRRFAEASGVRWYILSGRLGLLRPDEVIAPYELALGAMSARYRAAWGAFVVAQLAEVEHLAGLTVEIHAGDVYIDALRGLLEAAGANVVDPVDATSFGATLAWYDRAWNATPAEPPSATQAVNTNAVDGEAVAQLVATLRNPACAEPVSVLLARTRRALAVPGMYSWWVDDVGAHDLSQGLGYEVATGLIYAGQAGATRWPSGRPSTNTLWGRLVGMHLGSSAELSTFRLTLASILQSGTHDGIDETALTAWMTAHLSVIAVPISDADAIDMLETAVLAELNPPLNLAKRPPTPLRRRLNELRTQARAC